MSASYLVHHGIKGQEWGIQNGPPYPLDYEDHNAKEKRAASGHNVNSPSDTKRKKKKNASESGDASSKKSASAAKWRKEEITGLKYGITNPKTYGCKTKEEAIDKLNKMTDSDVERQQRIARIKTAAIIGGSAIVVAGVAAYLTPYIARNINRAAELKERIDPNKFMRFSQRVADGVDLSESNEDIALAPGSYLGRVSNFKNELTSNESPEVLFVNYSKADVQYYIGHLGDKKFMYEYENTVDLISPGAGKRYSIFADMVMKDKEFGDTMIEAASTIRTSAFGGSKQELDKLFDLFNIKTSEEKSSFIRQYISNEKTRDSMLRLLYQPFVKWQGVDLKSTEAKAQAQIFLNKSYFGKLKEMGYNMLLDDNDNGSMSTSATILLDPKNTICLKGKKVLNVWSRYSASKLHTNAANFNWKDTNATVALL